MPVSMAMRAENASVASAREGCTTNQPRRLLTSTMPRADRRAIASRTSVRLTPKTSASSCSPRRWPGAMRPDRMASTTWVAICGALEREGTVVVLKMRWFGASGPIAVQECGRRGLDALFVYKPRKGRARFHAGLSSASARPVP